METKCKILWPQAAGYHRQLNMTHCSFSLASDSAWLIFKSYNTICGRRGSIITLNRKHISQFLSQQDLSSPAVTFILYHSKPKMGRCDLRDTWTLNNCAKKKQDVFATIFEIRKPVNVRHLHPALGREKGKKSPKMRCAISQFCWVSDSIFLGTREPEKKFEDGMADFSVRCFFLSVKLPKSAVSLMFRAIK